MPMFDWCFHNDHERCAREYEITYWDGKKIVHTGTMRKCECTKRGCKCYVKKADRTKVRKTRARKK